MPAPANTSLSQCASLYNLRTATAEAAEYAAIPHFHPYSHLTSSAPAKARAQCPDGKERLSEPSGRGESINNFMPFPTMKTVANDIDVSRSISLVPCMDGTSRKFRPTAMAAGMNLRYSSADVPRTIPSFPRMALLTGTSKLSWAIPWIKAPVPTRAAGTMKSRMQTLSATPTLWA